MDGDSKLCGRRVQAIDRNARLKSIDTVPRQTEIVTDGTAVDKMAPEKLIKTQGGCTMKLALAKWRHGEP